MICTSVICQSIWMTAICINFQGKIVLIIPAAWITKEIQIAHALGRQLCIWGYPVQLPIVPHPIIFKLSFSIAEGLTSFTLTKLQSCPRAFLCHNPAYGGLSAVQVSVFFSKHEITYNICVIDFFVMVAVFNSTGRILMRF